MVPIPRPRRWRTACSPISPTPITIAVLSSSRSKIVQAKSTAAELTETALAAMRVSVRTRFATENDLWNQRCSTVPNVPSSDDAL